MADDPDQPPAFIEGELASYRVENDLLARELVLTRRVIQTLPFSAAKGPGAPLLLPVPVPRTVASGDDLYFSVDRCESGEKLVHLAGWAFSPRIDFRTARLTVILDGLDGTYIVQPHRVLRPDVAAIHAQTDFGAALPLNSPGRAHLAQCGFAGLVSRAELGKGLPYRITLQIDGPEVSARRSTDAILHG